MRAVHFINMRVLLTIKLLARVLKNSYKMVCLGIMSNIGKVANVYYLELVEVQ